MQLQPKELMNVLYIPRQEFFLRVQIICVEDYSGLIQGVLLKIKYILPWDENIDHWN